MHFRFHWKSVALTSILIIGPVMLSMMSTSCDNEIPIYEIIDQETFAIKEGKYPDVLIQIRYIPRVISAALNAPYKEVSGVLYATSPAPPRIINKISQLSITMNETYSQNYPANAELNSLFDVVDHPDKSSPSLNYPIEIGENWSLYLYLREPPDIDLNTRFTITTTMDNGRVMTSQTTFITILK